MQMVENICRMQNSKNDRKVMKFKEIVKKKNKISVSAILESVTSCLLCRSVVNHHCTTQVLVRLFFVHSSL